MSVVDKIREPIVEGIFYCADELSLENEVKNLLGIPTETRSDAFAIISPHAGYSFCGSSMAAGFQSAAERHIDNVVLISPVHREPADEIYLTESSKYRTPLGLVDVNVESVNELESCSTRFIRNDIPHLEEHGIEVQLPFVQHIFPEAAIVPILLGRATMSNARILARALEAVFSDVYERTLIIVSSNLCSHCDEDTAASETSLFRSLIEKRDSEEIVKRFHRKELTACGAGAVASLLLMDITFGDIVFHTQQNSREDDHCRADPATYYGAISIYSE